MIPAMQELYRVLKPGGMAILQIPQDLKRDDNIWMIYRPKERANIWTIRPRAYLRSRLFRQINYVGLL
jgi:ubiquinone/menaquinone biosynthesis C-methylase UbiE